MMGELFRWIGVATVIYAVVCASGAVWRGLADWLGRPSIGAATRAKLDAQQAEIERLRSAVRAKGVLWARSHEEIDAMLYPNRRAWAERRT